MEYTVQKIWSEIIQAGLWVVLLNKNRSIYNMFEIRKFMNSDFERVFYHELGHLLAHKLNFKFFNIGGVEEIQIIEHNIDGRTYYTGKTISQKPKNYVEKEDVRIVNLPEKVIELVYGCIIQSLKLQNNLFQCFCETGHGDSDYFGFTGGLISYGKYNKKQEMERLFNKHLQDLIESNSFKLIESIQVELFVTKMQDQNIYTVNIDELDAIIQPFIEIIEPHYLEIMSKIRELINGEI